jgi:hypothetical protein
MKIEHKLLFKFYHELPDLSEDMLETFLNSKDIKDRIVEGLKDEVGEDATVRHLGMKIATEDKTVLEKTKALNVWVSIEQTEGVKVPTTVCHYCGRSVEDTFPRYYIVDDEFIPVCAKCIEEALK